MSCPNRLRLFGGCRHSEVMALTTLADVPAARRCFDATVTDRSIRKEVRRRRLGSSLVHKHAASVKVLGCLSVVRG
jgi:hypothetical protein